MEMGGADQRDTCHGPENLEMTSNYVCEFVGILFVLHEDVIVYTEQLKEARKLLLHHFPTI